MVAGWRGECFGLAASCSTSAPVCTGMPLMVLDMATQLIVLVLDDGE